MSTRKEAAQRRANALRHLRRAAQLLKRAEDVSYRATDSLDGDDEALSWPFAIGAAQSCIWQALASLGDRTLLDEWNARFKSECEARLAAKQTEAEARS